MTTITPNDLSDRAGPSGRYSGPEVIAPGHNYATVTNKISKIILTSRPPIFWVMCFGVALAICGMFTTAVAYLLYKGVGVWGIDVPVMWGFAIVNFVWWIGIGHAGTLISAILLLLRQEWRTSINRFAEAMTLFAVACAGMFPLLHLGRFWLAYWLTPYPNPMGLWPQWRSPLVWDVFAVSTYGTVSLLYWYVGLIPDLATLRDRAQNKYIKLAYGIFALGWRGSAFHWQRYQSVYILLAGLCTPLVVSVHTVVSFDFTIGTVPGWHSTIFPPYFVAGAILSGFAMVLTLAIPLRKFYHLEDLITMKHLNACALLMLVTGSIVGYGYMMEIFMGWYSGNVYEKSIHLQWRPFGPYWWSFWGLMFCNIFCVQLLWFKPLRNNVAFLFIMSLIVNTGMWLERYVIVVTSLANPTTPSGGAMYAGTKWDWMTYIGTLGVFTFLFCLFLRALPVISIAEVRELVLIKEGSKDAASGPDPSDAQVATDLPAATPAGLATAGGHG